MNITSKDDITLKLAHYFITEKNYTPIVVYGVKDEIWLENLDNDYKVIRIVSHYIHNNEQLNFDRFKVNRVVKLLKKKTLSFKMDVLNIYTDLGDAVNIKEKDTWTDFYIKKIADLKKSPIKEVFPDIVEKTRFKEKGVEFLLKVTEDINNKNRTEEIKNYKVFSKKKPYITYIIMTLCIIIFAMMYIFGDGSYDDSTLIKFGANWDLLVKSGEYYRLLASAFLHIGIMHLLCNMYSLYVIGPQIENFFGKAKFICIYFISAISGNILSVALNNNILSAGASGAIFGLLGAMLYFGYHYRIYLGNVLKSQIIPVIVLNLILGFMVTEIDNFAHIGGLVGGILSAMAVGIPKDNTKMEKINGKILLVIYLAFITYLAFFAK